MRKNAKAIRVPVTRSRQALPHAFHTSDTSGTCKSNRACTPLGKRPGSVALGFSWCTCPVPMLLCAPHSHCSGVHRLRMLGFRGALAWVGDPDQSSNQLALQARLNVRAIEKCRWKGLNMTHETRNRVIPDCFLGTGPEMIALPADFCWIGPAAFEHCTGLQTVDIFRTGIQEIVGGTFACCPNYSASN